VGPRVVSVAKKSHSQCPYWEVHKIVTYLEDNIHLHISPPKPINRFYEIWYLLGGVHWVNTYAL